MAKIVEAANAMVANPDKITNVILAGKESFYLYKGKYKWSMTSNENGDYKLFYYPGNESIDELVDITINGHWDERIPVLAYSCEDIGTVEARETFKELFTLVTGKAFGIDQALDDIISDLF